MVGKQYTRESDIAIDDLQRAIDPSEAIALRRSRAALSADEAKALLAVKRVFGDSKIIYRGPHE